MSVINLWSKPMKAETLRFLVMAAIYSLALFGAALLVGCSVPARYIAECTFVQPENCN